MSHKRLCFNCEYHQATICCLDCDHPSNIYCEECCELHLRVKQNKLHKTQNMSHGKQNEIICSNCEDQIATTKCSDCSESESYFCEDCSHVHKQIKKYKYHNVVSLVHNKNSSNIRRINNCNSKFGNQKLKSLLLDYWDALRDYYLSMADYVEENGLAKPVMIAIASMLFILLFFLRVWFGRNILIVVLAILMIAIRYYMHYGQSELQTTVKPETVDMLIPKKIPSLKAAAAYADTLQQQRQQQHRKGKIEFSDEMIDDKREFEDEFWHSRSGVGGQSGAAEDLMPTNMFGSLSQHDQRRGFVAPHFKPRTRLYRRRPAAAATDGNSVAASAEGDSCKEGSKGLAQQ